MSRDQKTHTPGPWTPEPEVRAEGQTSWGIWSNHIPPNAAVGADGTWILLDSTSGYVEANARLIAAAPELAASLRDILGRFQSCIAQGNGEIDGDAEAVERARAVLAKTEGVNRNGDY